MHARIHVQILSGSGILNAGSDTMEPHERGLWTGNPRGRMRGCKDPEMEMCLETCPLCSPNSKGARGGPCTLRTGRKDTEGLEVRLESGSYRTLVCMARTWHFIAGVMETTEGLGGGRLHSLMLCF